LTEQPQIVFDEGKGLSTEAQQYEQTSLINAVRHEVGRWRTLPNPNTWQVTPETARLLHHWRHHEFNTLRPFFCQIEAVETAIWLTEVAPTSGKAGKGFFDANLEIMRLALKHAKGAGKTTLMAMLIAWQAGSNLC
jgi:type III restriction enzyme